MITMLGLFIVVTYVEQRLIVLPNTAGKKELYGSNPCSINLHHCNCQMESFPMMHILYQN